MKSKSLILSIIAINALCVIGAIMNYIYVYKGLNSIDPESVSRSVKLPVIMRQTADTISNMNKIEFVEKKERIITVLNGYADFIESLRSSFIEGREAIIQYIVSLAIVSTINLILLLFVRPRYF